MKKFIKTIVAMLLAVVVTAVAYGCGKTSTSESVGSSESSESSKPSTNTAYNITLL